VWKVVEAVSSLGEKYCCPVCGCPSSEINRPENVVDLEKHLRRCPRCGSVLRSFGRIYTVVRRSRRLDGFFGTQTQSDSDKTHDWKPRREFDTLHD
jgi:Zn-finger nucleic acid-binding protein